MQKYEIWVGNYHLGQGHHGSTEPEMVGVAEGINFQVACFKHELQSMYKSCCEQERKGYVDSQSMEWFYRRATNSNSLLGKYYETREEALNSFTRE